MVDGWYPSTQLPEPSQESVPSQTPPFDVPVQVVVAVANPSAGHEPDEPLQLSATSHAPADARQVVVEGLYPSTQCPDPSQESVASQSPPFEVPVHEVVAEAKPSAGQAPDVPEQLSATSHAPADARQTVVDGLYPSTQFPDPSQESVASQPPPLEVPLHEVVAVANPSAGQLLVLPSQLSATSHWPADSRQVVVDGWYPSTQLPEPSQESVPSQTPPLDVPVQVVVAVANPSTGHEPDEPVQLSATSH